MKGTISFIIFLILNILTLSANSEEIAKSGKFGIIVQDYGEENINKISPQEIYNKTLRIIESGHMEIGIMLIEKAFEDNKGDYLAKNIASLYLQDGQLNKALEIYRQLITKYPKSPQLMNSYVKAISIAYPRRSMKEITKIAKENPSLYKLYVKLADMYNKINKHREAAYYYLSAWQNAPQEYLYLYNAAVSFDKIGDKNEAIRFYKMSLEVKPESENQYINKYFIEKRIQEIQMKG